MFAVQAIDDEAESEVGDEEGEDGHDSVLDPRGTGFGETESTADAANDTDVWGRLGVNWEFVGLDAHCARRLIGSRSARSGSFTVRARCRL